MPRPPRAVWKGFVSFGLVLIPVRLVPAESPERTLDLDLIDPRDGARIRSKRVNERTGEEVSWEAIARGFRLPDGTYVLLDDSDFERAAATVRRGLDIEGFVSRDDLSPLHFDKPYYLAADKGGERLLALLHESLAVSGRVGIARAVLHARERLCAVMPAGDALAAITLRYSEQLRRPADVPGAALGGPRPPARERELAHRLVDQMAGPFVVESYHDQYQAALRRLIRAKAAKAALPAPKPPPQAQTDPDEVVDLLTRSLEAATTDSGQGPSAAGGLPAKPAKRSRRAATGAPKKSD